MSDTKERIPFTSDFCFHPDIAQAAESYRRGDKEAFSKALSAHREAVRRGERFWEGDDGSDQALIDFIGRKSEAYTRRTGDRCPPSSPGRQEKFAKLKKHWTDVPLGIRRYPQDEE